MSSEEDRDDSTSEDRFNLILGELKSLKGYVTKKLDDIKEINSKILVNQEELKKEIKIIKKDSSKQKELILAQGRRINFLEKQLLENTINIQNIPVTDNEVVSDIVYNIFGKLNVKLTTSSVVKAYRKKPKVDGRSGDIVVKLGTASVFESILFEAKKKKLTTQDFGYKGESRKIFVNQELSFLNKLLLFEAKGLQRKNNWKFVWEKGGFIYIRKVEGEHAIKLTSLDQLKSL